jgi:hypothetical protein
MKLPFVSSAARVSALALTITVGVALCANAATTAGTVVPVAKKKRAAVAVVGVPRVPSSGTPGAIGLLDQAYGLLRTADHDYKGHRAHAMHDIEAAARELGATVGGGGKGKEKQATSDSQLRDAQGLLGQAVGDLTGKAHHHIEVAISQLSIALKIK